MDRFKFRAWDSRDGGWRTDFTIEPEAGEICDQYGCSGNRKDFIVMACTGLKDKNGKLIYESDMCLLSGLSYQVVWFGYCWAFLDDPEYHYGNGYLKFPSHKFMDFDETGEPGADYYKSCEVIGNIYENPELIKGR